MKGFVNISKPKGISSSLAVQKVKWALRNAVGEKVKVGHFGTLDPLASGVLVIAVGNATRLFDMAQDKVKVYQATFKFGVETDTLDGEGEIVDRCDKHITADEILSVIGSLVGKQNQIPPKYSAKSVDGKRAYKLAREGKQVELRAKEIEIYDFKLLGKENEKVVLKGGEHILSENEFAFEIACSSGTYIRAIARDLANRLGTVGYMSSLLRVQSGAFLLENAVSIDEFSKNPLAYVLPIECDLAGFEVFELPKECETHALNGVQLHFDNLPKGRFVVKLDGEVVGIAKNVENKLKFEIRL